LFQSPQNFILSDGLPKIHSYSYFSQTPSTMARQKKSLDGQYRPHLVRFFSWKDGVQHAKTFNPEPAAFNGITPHMLTRYLKFLSYGTATPGPDDHPTQ
jgi:hypothetical protein